MPTVTLALIVANVAVYLLQMLVPNLELSFGLWPLAAADATGGQVGFQPWQLVTYAFLHGSISHIAFNMYGLYLFGGALERVVGERRYLTYYFVCVITAAIAQLIVAQMTGGVYPTVGASGGIFGLMLGYAAYFPNNKLMLIFVPIPIPSRVFVVLYGALELFFGVTGTESGVAHFAHLGGLVGGAIMLLWWRRGRLRRP